MKKQTKSLQKFTEPITEALLVQLHEKSDIETLKGIRNELAAKIDAVINQVGDVSISQVERNTAAKMFEEATKQIISLYSIIDKPHHKAENERIRRITYDINRNAIMKSISELAQRNNKIPSQTEITLFTGLSRTTVIKHLSDLSTDQEYKEIKYATAALLPKVLAKLFSLGMAGDVKALKVLLDFHKHESATMFIRNQNNNFQMPKMGKELADEVYI